MLRVFAETNGNTRRRGYIGKNRGLIKTRTGAQESGRHQPTALSGLAMAKAYYAMDTMDKVDTMDRVDAVT
jgi:hypothetical protein